MVFHLFASSISFFIVLQFSEYRSFTSLVNFFSGCFSLFDAIINGIVFLISFSDCYWCIKIQLISGYLVSCYFTEFIYSYSFFLLDYLGLSGYIVLCHLQIMSILLFPFQFRCLLLMAVSRTFNTILNNTSGNGQPWLVHGLKEKAKEVRHH